MNEIKIAHFGLTDIGSVRTANEDSFGSVHGPYGPIFTVCDGMGGHVGGATASTLAVKTILEFISTSTVENPSVTINNALISANQKILETVYANPDLRGMGTTSVVLVVQPEGMYIGHVGDSRIYIYSDNQLYRLTKDDSFVQTLIDSGAITDEEAEQHPRKNELMKALGVADAVQPTILSKPIKPRKDDILLLCSDGLCGLVTDTKMQQILSSYPDLQMACEQLITAAKEAGGDDNITVQLIRVTDSPYKHSEFVSFNHRLTDTLTAIPVSKFSPTQLPPENSKEPKKKNKIPFPLIILLLALFLLLGVTYVTKTWPFNGLSITAGKDTTTALETPGEDGFLSGDRLRGDYLIHSVGKNDTSLAYLMKVRKQLKTEPYREFNFDITYAPNNEPVNQDNFKRFEQIKWKKSEIPFQNTTIVLDENQERQLKEDPKTSGATDGKDNKTGKNDSTTGKKPDTTVKNIPIAKPGESIPELEGKLRQAEIDLANAKTKLTEAEKKFHDTSDSVDAYVRSPKLPTWEKALGKARRELTAAQDKKNSSQSNHDKLSAQLEALKNNQNKPE